MKGMVLPGTLFEELGFNYIGPIDGHDIAALVRTLRNMRDAAAVRSCCTWSPARARATRRPRPTRSPTTAPGPFDPASGTIRKDVAGGPQLHAGLRRVAVRHGRARPAPGRHHAGDARRLRHGGVFEALPGPLLRRRHRRAARGDLAAGLACEGMQPVVAIYSTFLQRAYDQLIHDVALQNLPVLFAHRPRRPGRRRRRHARGQLRPVLPALRPEHGRDGAGRRERMPPDAVHRRPRSTGPAAVRYPRGQGPGVPIAGVDDGPAGRQGARCAARAARACCCCPSARMVAPALAAGRTRWTPRS